MKSLFVTNKSIHEAVTRLQWTREALTDRLTVLNKDIILKWVEEALLELTDETIQQ